MEIKLVGFSELQKRLQEFGPKVAANEQRNATRAAAVVFRDAVRMAAPVRTGLLKANIIVNKRRSTEGRFVVKYGVRIKAVKQKYGNTSANRRNRRVGKRFEVEGPAFYGRFIEYGTSKMRAQPFMRPAFGSNVDKAIEAFRMRMAKGVEDAAKKQ
jgi:HK97 gp10 family phage protein